MIFNEIFEQRLQVRENCCIIYDKYIGRKSTTATLHRSLNMTIQRTKAYSGQMTTGARKRITKAVNLLTMIATPKRIYNEVLQREVTHRLSFITLTISENTRNLTAKEAYKTLLEKFLLWMKRTKGVKHYIWKAELQNRGQIHYHITTTSFLNWKEIRQKWNRLQIEAGLLEDFYARYGHNDPNSTDVHEVYTKKDLTSYLIKYVSKAGGKEDKTTGKLWDCSESLKDNNYPDYEFTDQQQRFLEALIITKCLYSKGKDHCTIIKIPGHPTNEMLCEEHYEQFYKDVWKIATYRRRTCQSEDQSEDISELFRQQNIPQQL